MKIRVYGSTYYSSTGEAYSSIAEKYSAKNPREVKEGLQRSNLEIAVDRLGRVIVFHRKINKELEE